MPQETGEQSPELVRGLGLPQAIALNVANMVGIGPFITIPAFIKAMHGPQALVAWVIAAVLIICDGLVWSELGAALPGSGGTYHFLKEIFDRSGRGWGRLLPFLFIWQFLISGTLELASGYIGATAYLDYVYPGLDAELLRWGLPGGSKWIAAASTLIVTAVLCRRIETIGWLGITLCAGTLATVLVVIVSGLTHFNPRLLTIPANGLDITQPGFATSLGAAMSIAIYDYFGYYNVCHLGGEVKDPGKTIPRAVIISVLLVASIYLTMNVSIIAVVPWEQAMDATNIAADFMETLYGRPIAVAFTWLILWTVAACMFSSTLGYSRIPFAAAQNGDFFPVFAKLHPTRRYPIVSLWVMGVLTALFCFFDLQDVIFAAVTVRIFIQFIMQIVALHIMRTTRPDIVMPFRMRFYPLPSLIALAGWIFVLATSTAKSQLVGLVVLTSGVVVYFLFLFKPSRNSAVTKTG